MEINARTLATSTPWVAAAPAAVATVIGAHIYLHPPS
jgi:hypothetical protein